MLRTRETVYSELTLFCKKKKNQLFAMYIFQNNLENQQQNNLDLLHPTNKKRLVLTFFDKILFKNIMRGILALIW